MEIKGYHKGHATKTVSIFGIENEFENEVIDFALAHAGETRSSLFGITLKVVDDFSGPEIQTVTVVSLHTD